MLTHHNSYYHLLQVELVLPKQVCRELLYGYVEKTEETSYRSSVMMLCPARYAEKPVQHPQYHPQPHHQQHAAPAQPYLHHSSIKYVNKVG